MANHMLKSVTMLLSIISNVMAVISTMTKIKAKSIRDSKSMLLDFMHYSWPCEVVHMVETCPDLKGYPVSLPPQRE